MRHRPDEMRRSSWQDGRHAPNARDHASACVASVAACVSTRSWTRPLVESPPWWVAEGPLSWTPQDDNPGDPRWSGYALSARAEGASSPGRGVHLAVPVRGIRGGAHTHLQETDLAGRYRLR